MNENDVKLALALLGHNCPGCQLPESLGAKPELAPWCNTCGGTGKVPLLDPALVRKPCPGVSPDDFGCVTWIDAYKQELHMAGRCPCEGRGWFPSNNQMDWVRALNKLGLDVAYRSRSPVDEVDVYEDYDILRGYGKTIFEAAAQALGVAPDA